MKRWPGLASFALFIALCVSASYWGMQLFKPALRPVTAPAPAQVAEYSPDAAAGLFGGRAAAIAAASNYQLKGVVLAKNGRESGAILSVDGKPAQAININAEVAPGVTLKEVHAQYVLLAEGGIVKRVDLPENAKAQPNPALGAPMMPQAQPMIGSGQGVSVVPNVPNLIGIPVMPDQNPGIVTRSGK